MEFQLRFELTNEEYGDFNVYTVWSAPEQKKLRKKTFLSTLFLTLGFAILGVFISQQLSTASKQRSLVDPVIIVIVVVVAATVTLITYNRVASKTKSKAIQLVEKEDNNHILSDAEMEFREDGFTHTDSKSKSIQTWQSIIKYIDVNNSFYLYINSVQAFIIPKRVFASTGDIERFHKFLEEKIPLSSSFRSMGI